MSLKKEIIETYYQLKNTMDAAYKVFKKEPSVTNATRHTTAAQAFTTFCLESMAAAVGDTEDTISKEEILANIAEYKTCKTCDSEILYQIDDKHYIESSDFVPEFPGWCHTCLVTHCCEQDCETCTVASDPSTCSFKATKNLYLQSE